VRVSVVGSSGAGKSTLARYLAEQLGTAHVELDSIYHQSGWRPLPEAQLTARVAEFAAGDDWVIDGNYSAVRLILWARADVVVWLDLPRLLVFRRLAWRTLRRGAMRTELWNGNRESLLNLFRGGDANLLWWAWRQHGKYRRRYASAMADPANAAIRFIRIRRRAEADPAAVLARILEPNPNIGRTAG
jgi:adenylate kinase family enzyme